MASTLVSDLISRARAISDMQDDFVKPAEWLFWAAVENKKLAVKVARLGVPLNETEILIPLNGSLSYSIAESMALMAVYFVEPDGRYKKLKLISSVQKRFTGSQTTSGTGNPLQYHAKTSVNNLVLDFYPTPSTGTCIAQILPAPPATLALTDTVSFPLGWEDLIVLRMARKALAKEETVSPMIESEIKEMTEYIEESAPDFIMADQPVVRNWKEDDLNAPFDSENGWFWC